MGYAYYDLGDGFGDRGYAVDDVCHKDGCTEEIDRGLAHLCYRCERYFCGAHLLLGREEKDCFAGSGRWVCKPCFDEQEQDDLGEASPSEPHR